MSAARITSGGTVFKLDGTPVHQRATEADVQEPRKLARLLTDAHKAAAEVAARHDPARVDHEDIVVDATGATQYRLHHGFGGRVRWWVVDWRSATAGPQLVYSSSSDNDTLVLVSYVAGTATIRIEEAG